MVGRSQALEDLIALSRWLGAAEQDCAILGEGNASTRASESSFFVKASGFELGKLDQTGVVEVDLDRCLALLEMPDPSDSEVRAGLTNAKVNDSTPRMPSVEAALHAICLTLPGIEFVGHSHPTAINSITCSAGFEKILRMRLFPDHIVVCGIEPLLLPYIDPGVPLAKAFREATQRYVDQHGIAPKTVYLQNHGFIALGTSAKQVQAITSMAVKAARIAIGTFACGGPVGMDDSYVRRIATRPDEHHRQRIIDR